MIHSHCRIPVFFCSLHPVVFANLNDGGAFRPSQPSGLDRPASSGAGELVLCQPLRNDTLSNKGRKPARYWFMNSSRLFAVWVLATLTGKGLGGCTLGRYGHEGVTMRSLASQPALIPCDLSTLSIDEEHERGASGEFQGVRDAIVLPNSHGEREV